MCCVKNKKKDFAANFAMMTVSILYEKCNKRERNVYQNNIISSTTIHLFQTYIITVL